MKTIIDEIDREHQSKRDQYPDSGYVYFSCNHGSYVFECYFNRKGDKEIIVTNEKKEDRDYPNLEEFLTSNTLDWDDIEPQVDEEYDEWNEHGFRDAQDYYNYRYN